MTSSLKECLRSLQPTLLSSVSTCPPQVNPEHPEIAPQGVLDPETYQSIEAARLFKLMDCTETRIGSAVFLRSLANPLTDLSLLEAKQESIRALERNPDLRQRVQSLVSGLRNKEQKLYDLLFGTFLGLIGSKANPLEVEGYGYDAFIHGNSFLTLAANGAADLKGTGHPYLDAILESMSDFRESRAYRLARGPVYRTEKGVIPKEEKSILTPCVRFNPSLFKPLGIAIFLGLLFLVGSFVPVLLDLVAGLAGAFWIFLFPLAFLYIPIMGGFDRDGCIYPFRDQLKKSPEVHRLLDDIGLLDELLCLLRYPEKVAPHAAILPSLENLERFQASFKGIRNPILAAEMQNYVGNDIDLSKVRLTLITGPNSGGKTAFCKTLAQSQLMAQIGGFVVAEAACTTLADKIRHQAPEISQLRDGEGRFGTELRRTKEIFMSISPRSLVIMDELSEGTTHEEKIEISMNILDGFSKKG